MKNRLPPGQKLTETWPVLHYGSVPRVDQAGWTFKVVGELADPRIITWEEFSALPRKKVICDIHCVTTWSRYDNTFEGVSTSVLANLAPPHAEAAYVMIRGEAGYTTNLPLKDFLSPDALFATHHNGAPLSAEHGAPVRLVVPHLYFWKSAKWVTGMEYMRRDRAGFWEQNGYHMRGDPWSEERFD